MTRRDAASVRRKGIAPPKASARASDGDETDDGHLFQGEIGSYKSGVFYSTATEGIPWEADLLFPSGVGREKSHFTGKGTVTGGPQKTKRLFTFFHETAHYVHDLSLGTSIARDLLLDEAGAILLLVLADATQHGTVRCPISLDDVNSLPKGAPNQRDALAHVLDRRRFAKSLLNEAPKKEWFGAGLWADLQGFAEDVGAVNGLSLLEGIVATKAAIALWERAGSAEDLWYLLKGKKAILPEHQPEVYRRARRLFDRAIGSPLLGTEGYTADDWPTDYDGSLRRLGDVAFLMLADVALHVPPPSYVLYRVQSGQNALVDFSPGFRFCFAIAALRHLGGFPPYPDDAGADATHQFYRDLFDLVSLSSSRPWPDFETTSAAWLQKMDERKRQRQSASDGYRFRLLVERELRPSDIVQGDAIVACALQDIPIFHLTPSGYKRLRVIAGKDDWVVAPWDQASMYVYETFHRETKPWRDSTLATTVAGALESGTDKVNQLEQEIVHRAFFMALQRATLDRPYMSCPFAGHGCDAAVPGCTHIMNLGTIPTKRCALRDYLTLHEIEPSRITWQSV